MNGLLSELGKNLAARWVQYLVPTGLLYLAVAAAGVLLGHERWYDAPELARHLDGLARHPGAKSAGVVILAAVLILLTAIGCGLVVRALSGAVHQLWCGPWPRSAHRLDLMLTGRRRRRWAQATAALDRAWREKALAQAAKEESPSQVHDEPARLNAARNRISLVEPARPTWIGDRLRAVDLRVFEHYHLDLDSAWPRLWLIIPETARAELRAARDGYDGATRLMGWALLYLLISAWWWPAIAIAAVLATISKRSGRAAMDAFCELVESAVDLYNRDLSAALGLPCPDGPVSPDHGQIITRHLRKGT